MRSLGVKNKRKCKKKGLKMKTIEQLKAEIKAFLEEMRRLKTLCETEKREFSEDEGKKIDEIMSKIEENRTAIERLEKLESRKNKLAALDSELNQPENRATKPSEPEIRTEKARFTLPASARATRCSFIKDDAHTGVKANERAYRI
jgi:chromosome segregation ATPase